MATTNNSMRGKVGNTIFYKVGDQTRARSAPAVYLDANTGKQQECRSQLRVATRFYQYLAETPLREVWRVAARGMSGTGFNFFMKLNLKLFNPNGKIADFSRLRLTVGMLQEVNHLVGSVGEDDVVTLVWGKNAGLAPVRERDRLLVVVLYGNRSFSPVLVETGGATRGDGKAAFRLKRKRGTAAHVYCFFEANNRGAYSSSQYLRV